MADRVTVLVVDDHLLFASSLARVIGEMERYRLTGIAVTGPQALAMVRQEQPEIVLLDYHLPGYSADTLIPSFLEVSPRTRIIVLTSDTSDAAMSDAIRAGAIGFMTKDRAIDDVLEALFTVANGGTMLTPRQRQIAAGAAPAAQVGSLELRLVGIGSFAQAVLIERSIDRLTQVGQVYIRDLVGDRASLRVALQPGASTAGLAHDLVEGSRGLRLTGTERGTLELQVEAPVVDG